MRLREYTPLPLTDLPADDPTYRANTLHDALALRVRFPWSCIERAAAPRTESRGRPHAGSGRLRFGAGRLYQPAIHVDLPSPYLDEHRAESAFPDVTLDTFGGQLEVDLWVSFWSE